MRKHLNKSELIAFVQKQEIKLREGEEIREHLTSCEKCQKAIKVTQVLTRGVCAIQEEGKRRIPDSILVRIKEFAKEPLKARLYHLASEFYGPSILKGLDDLPVLIQERLETEELPLAAAGGKLKGDLVDSGGNRLGDLLLEVEVAPKISKGMLNFAFSAPEMTGSPAAVSVELPPARVMLFAERIEEGGLILGKVKTGSHGPGPPLLRDVFVPLGLLKVLVIMES